MGAASPGRWHAWQCFCRIGRTSPLKVTEAACAAGSHPKTTHAASNRIRTIKSVLPNLHYPVALDVLEDLRVPARPGDLQLLSAGFLSQAETHQRLARRSVSYTGRGVIVKDCSGRQRDL